VEQFYAMLGATQEEEEGCRRKKKKKGLHGSLKQLRCNETQPR
jgi:hypothetical protein